jgi:hypothetical protein
MAISTFAELKTAVANKLARSDLTARIAEFVEIAHDKLNLELRIRAMEGSETLTITAQTEALPTRYISMRRLYIDGSPNRQLEFLVPMDFWARYLSSEQNKPQAYTIEGDNLVFGPIPDGTYSLRALFWQAFADLSADADTNWLLTNASGLYFYGALIEAYSFLDDTPSVLKWAALQDDLLAKVKRANKRDRYSGSSLVIRSDVQSPQFRTRVVTN